MGNWRRIIKKKVNNNHIGFQLAPGSLEKIVNSIKVPGAATKNKKVVTVKKREELANIALSLADLLAATNAFLDSVEPAIKHKNIKSTKKKMAAPFSALVKAIDKGGLTLEKAKPNVEKLRAATRDMNKYLKKITV